MRTFARLIIVGLLLSSMFVTLPRSAFACSCMMPPDPQTAMGQSEVVFAGQVVSIVDRNMGQQSGSMDPLLTTFQVNTVWKGPTNASITVSSARDSASCGYTFEQGREYIVYANVFEGQLSTNICTRTALLADAQADVAALGEGQAVAQIAPDPSSTTPWLLGAVVVAAVVALIALGAGLVMVRRKQT